MRFHTHHKFAAIGLLWAALAADSHAQMNLPFGPENYEHDFQLFAPVELDLDNEPYVDDHGYTLEYNKLAWSFSGERVMVGDPDAVVLAEQVYIQRNQDQGSRPDPYIVKNGLTDVTPDAGFGFGDRYEIGYRDRGNGWAVGILDGPELHQNQVFGFSEFIPFIDPAYTDATGDPTTAPGAVANGNLRAFGFGSVPVNFKTPPGYLFGFRDYLNFLAEAAIGTQGGPILYVGNYGLTAEDDFDDLNDIQITFFRLTDDIDGDLIPGSGFVLDGAGNVILEFTDFQDLHEFNIFFDLVSVRSTTKTSGVEAMWTHELTNRHYQAKHQNNHVELSFGARYFRLYDNFRVDALGSILGRSFWDTTMVNQIVGPQVAATWVNERQRWVLSSGVRFVFGYNVQDWRQTNGMGEELIPAATNRPLYGRPTYSNHGLQQEDFSPVGELRVAASYYLTQSVALTAGYQGMFVGNIRRASTSVNYELPDMGYRESGTQDLIVNGVNVGIEFVY